MKRMTKTAVVLALAGVAAGNAVAMGSDDPPIPGYNGVPRATVAQDPRTGADFGTGTNILQIPAAAFAVRSGPAPTYNSTGYLAFGGSTSLWAPVYLPSGANISWVDAYYCDAAPTAGINFFLTRYTGWSDANRAFEDIVSFTSVDGTGSGCQYDNTFLSGGHSVNNDVRFNGGGQYVINTQSSGAGVSFKGVDIWWTRPISPAPASASFTDVPLGHPFFTVIEALKASGITAGCTATQFCPDAPVSRAAMAAFLARALGLYWPY